MDPLSLLLGAALATGPAALAWFAGRASGLRAARPATGSTLLCSCGHGYGTHEDEQRCHGVDRHKRNGVAGLDPCPCRRYDGPEPLPRAWTPFELPGGQP